VSSQADRDGDWISWAQASELTGLPVRVIEWWKRQGRIEHRSEDKRRPTLRRQSVEEFADWYRARQDARRGRSSQYARDRARRRANLRPPAGWILLAEAASRLNLSRSTLIKRINRGTLTAEKHGDRWWVPWPGEPTPQPAWITYEEAAEIIGCDPSQVARLRRKGLIDGRTASGRRPSIDRSSVETYLEGRRRTSEE